MTTQRPVPSKGAFNMFWFLIGIAVGHLDKINPDLTALLGGLLK